MFNENNADLYEYIYHKLISLTEIRDNVLSKLNVKNDDIATLKKEFGALEKFEKKFTELLNQ